ncbi:MAG TPA: 6-carboxytetrahydropterin synthase [Acidobacteriaceae bacterium]|jgi:6-pyruvoyltetrahydropterin/6-carboxytetrahydropterin synthase|nr:6-carboxytetrahydropterin synthase [Acidobacteriaceae bacterium]
MKAYLSRRYRVSASHRLHTELFSADKNEAVYGKCNNPHGHGHNYTVEVMLSGEVDPVTGMVCNLGELDGFVRREVVDRFDEKNLNMDRSFAALVPTTENLCVEIYGIIRAGFRDAKLEKIRIEETSNNYFEYAG